MSEMSPRRIVQSWLVVVACMTLALKAVDRVPALLSGAPHGVRAYASVADAERAIGARIWMPAYYPDSIAWPPTRVDAWPGPPTVVALRMNGRETRRERLVIVQSLAGTDAVPAQLLPPGEVLTLTDVLVGRQPGTIARLVAPGGEVVHDVRWTHGRRAIVVRYYGPVEELLLIADSLERHSS
jgi:hypothetical protein